MQNVTEERGPARLGGRPRAIPCDLEGVVAQLYQHGAGYRAIARALRDEHGVDASFTTVKRVLKRLGAI